jgi:kynureninase
MGSRQHLREIKSGSPLPYTDDIRSYKKEYAEALDVQDPLRSFRDEFIIPSKKDMKRKTLVSENSAYQSPLYIQAFILTFSFRSSY